MVKFLLVAPDFSYEFVKDCGLEYELNLSLITAGSLKKIAEEEEEKHLVNKFAEGRMRSLIIILVFASVSTSVAQDCICLARVIPFFALTKNRIVHSDLNRSDEPFNYWRCDADEIDLDLLTLNPAGIDTLAMNLRSFYLLSCSDEIYNIYFDKSGLIEVNGVTYKYNRSFMEKLAQCILPEERWRYIPDEEFDPE